MSFLRPLRNFCVFCVRMFYLPRAGNFNHPVDKAVPHTMIAPQTSIQGVTASPGSSAP